LTIESIAQTQSKYQLLPDLSSEEYQSLKADIAEHGILVPVELDETGTVLDGHHRIRAWNELRSEGIKAPDYPRLIRYGMTEVEKERHIISLNINRRHLTKDQLNDLICQLTTEGMSTRAIAEVTGVSDTTVWRSKAGASNEAPQFITGKDGKLYPATKPRQPKTVIATNQQDESRVRLAIGNAGEDLPDKVITVKRATRIAREADAEIRRQNPAPAIIDSTIDLRVGDFREQLVSLPPESVDLICTDPPYNNDNVNLWQDLASFAKRVLKPGAWLVTYAGQAHLDEFICLLASELTYVWVISQVNSAAKKNIFHLGHIYSRWKPVLLFAKPPITPLTWVNDLIEGGGREKNLHDWQQSESEALYLLESFSLPGQLVIDPFLGSGTTAIAAKKLGRHFIGCDIDPANISKAMERLNAQN